MKKSKAFQCFAMVALVALFLPFSFADNGDRPEDWNVPIEYGDETQQALSTFDFDHDGYKEIFISDTKSMTILNYDGTVVSRRELPIGNENHYAIALYKYANTNYIAFSSEIELSEEGNLNFLNVYEDGLLQYAISNEKAIQPIAVYFPEAAHSGRNGLIFVSNNLYDGSPPKMYLYAPPTLLRVEKEITEVENLKISTFAVGDVDNDVGLEVVLYGEGDFDDGPAGILIYDIGMFNLEFKSAWSAEEMQYTASSMALADLDNDNLMEIIVSDMLDGIIGVYDLDGNLKEGWPKDFPMAIMSTPAIGNLGLPADKTLDVVIPNFITNVKLYALNNDASDVDGWPFVFSDLHFNFYGSPAIGDLDGDGLAEVAVILHERDLDGVEPIRLYLVVLNHDGTEMLFEEIAESPNLEENTPLLGAYEMTPIFEDLDNDGYAELIFLTNQYEIDGVNYATLYVKTFYPEGIYNSELMQWAHPLHDPQNTRSYDTPREEPVPNNCEKIFLYELGEWPAEGFSQNLKAVKFHIPRQQMDYLVDFPGQEFSEFYVLTEVAKSDNDEIFLPGTIFALQNNQALFSQENRVKITCETAKSSIFVNYNEDDHVVIYGLGWLFVETISLSTVNPDSGNVAVLGKANFKYADNYKTDSFRIITGTDNLTQLLGRHVYLDAASNEKVLNYFKFMFDGCCNVILEEAEIGESVTSLPGIPGGATAALNGFPFGESNPYLIGAFVFVAVLVLAVLIYKFKKKK